MHIISLPPLSHSLPVYCQAQAQLEAEWAYAQFRTLQQPIMEELEKKTERKSKNQDMQAGKK